MKLYGSVNGVLYTVKQVYFTGNLIFANFAEDPNSQNKLKCHEIVNFTLITTVASKFLQNQVAT